MPHLQINTTFYRFCDTINWPRIERATWVLLIAFYVAGDVLTTIISLELGGIETNELAVQFFTALGYPGLLIMKLFVVGIIVALILPLTLAGRKLGIDPAPFRTVIVGMFAVRGLALTAWNAYVILTIVTGMSSSGPPPF